MTGPPCRKVEAVGPVGPVLRSGRGGLPIRPTARCGLPSSRFYAAGSVVDSRCEGHRRFANVLDAPLIWREVSEEEFLVLEVMSS